MPIVIKSSIENLQKYALPVKDDAECLPYTHSPRLYAALLVRLILSPRLRVESSQPNLFNRKILPEFYCKRRPNYWKSANVFTPWNRTFCLSCQTLHSIGTCNIFTAVCSLCPLNSQCTEDQFYTASHYSEVVRSVPPEVRALIEQELTYYAKVCI